MAFIVEDGNGLEDATSYLSVVDFKAYHDDRGNSYSSFTDPQIQQALVRSTDYIERRWGARFLGRREFEDQALSFPRVRLFDEEGRVVEGIPKRLEQATAEYALRALSITLLPDPEIDATGVKVKESVEKVGPIEFRTEFADTVGRTLLRPYPAADRLLLDYVASPGVIRA